MPKPAYNVSIENATSSRATARTSALPKQGRARKGKADAKVDRVASDTRQDTTAKQAAASKEASADKRDAEYKVAIEKCDALAVP
jgi:hypothetical protein